MQTIRLGILDAVPGEYYLPGEASDPQKFEAMFGSIGAPFEYRSFAVTRNEFPQSVADCDAWLVTGSPCSAYDNYTWIATLSEFTREVSRLERPMVGICFGHQLIARSLGGRVELASDGWLLGLHEFSIHKPKPWMPDQTAGQRSLYFINQDQVTELPPDAELLAGSSRCPNALYTVGDRILSLQGHPEQPLASMKAFSKKLLDDYHLDRRVYDAALDSMAKRAPEASRFARCIADFVAAAVR